MISFFISSYSFRTLFIKTNSSWLITQSIKDVEINSSMQFNLDFDNDAILSCFFFFFLIIDLCFVILAVIAQNFNPVAELIIPIGIPTKEAKTQMETNPVIAEPKIRMLNII